MTNSHLLGFIAFGAFALAALLTWVVTIRHPDFVRDLPRRRRTRRTALFFLLFGAAFGGFAFAVDNELRVTTLYETMTDGSVGLAAGVSAPVRTVSFTVERPGTPHKLFLSPTSDYRHPARTGVTLSFVLQGPDGETVLPEQSAAFPVWRGRNARADWDGKTFPFTPATAGGHTLRITPWETDIARIQVRVTDPLKRNGNRMPGY